uniref:DUF7903 domain-containing protein n=1 Tax=Kalanchoe fedtschenkoi TaxID=63787 RepID=A0A7N0ZZ32_KALFE
MAYNPHHKWQWRWVSKEDPAAQLVPQFSRNLNLGSSSSKSNLYYNNDKHVKFVYGDKATGMWFSVGLMNGYQLPPSITLKEVSLPYALQLRNKVLLILVNSDEVDDKKRDAPLLKSPWTSIAGNVLEDVLSTYQNLRNECNLQRMDELNPGLVVRFGKYSFTGPLRLNHIPLKGVYFQKTL